MQNSKSSIPIIFIDNKALLQINQISQELFKDEFRYVRERDMLVALHTYLVQQGVQPNFEVMVEDEGTWWKP